MVWKRAEDLRREKEGSSSSETSSESEEESEPERIAGSLQRLKPFDKKDPGNKLPTVRESIEESKSFSIQVEKCDEASSLESSDSD